MESVIGDSEINRDTICQKRVCQKCFALINSSCPSLTTHNHSVYLTSNGLFAQVPLNVGELLSFYELRKLRNHYFNGLLSQMRHVSDHEDVNCEFVWIGTCLKVHVKRRIEVHEELMSLSGQVPRVINNDQSEFVDKCYFTWNDAINTLDHEEKDSDDENEDVVVEKEKRPRARKRPRRGILKEPKRVKEPKEPKEPRSFAKSLAKEPKLKKAKPAKDVVNDGDNREIFSFRGKNSKIKNGGVVTYIGDPQKQEFTAKITFPDGKEDILQSHDLGWLYTEIASK